MLPLWEYNQVNKKRNKNQRIEIYSISYYSAKYNNKENELISYCVVISWKGKDLLWSKIQDGNRMTKLPTMIVLVLKQNFFFF